MKKLLIVCSALLLILGFAGTAPAAPVYPVWVDASPDKNGGDGIPDDTIILRPSEVVWLDVFISNIPNSQLISAGLTVDFDPKQLEVTPGTTFFEPPWIGFMGSRVDFDNTAGTIDFVGGTLAPWADSDVPLITIELHCIAVGTSFLNFGDHPEPFADFVLADGTVLDGEIGFPRIEVINTPIPSALLLLGSGLLGLLGFRRKMKD